jgi:hypothetical protein
MFSYSGEPLVSPLVLHVRRVDQGDQYIHVEQAAHHGSSSRSRWTISEVTGDEPLRTVSKGIPFRFRGGGAGVSPFRASAKMISPIVLFSRTAISLAALSTSSSRVKRCSHIGSCIKHHTSNVHEPNRLPMKANPWLTW